MRKLIYGLLLTCSNLFASDLDTAKYSIPVSIVDSMFFEIQQGRQCTKLSVAQTIENQKLQAEIVAQGTVIRLKSNEITHLEELTAALQSEFNSTKIIKHDKINKLKVRIRKLMIIVVGETGIIILMVILLF